MSTVLRALRGATTVESDSAHAICAATETLLVTILDRNQIGPSSVISIVLTSTIDLTAADPADALAAAGLGDVASISARELDVDGALGHCIRALVHVDGDAIDGPVRHVFLEGARALRRDLVDD